MISFTATRSPSATPSAASGASFATRPTVSCPGTTGNAHAPGTSSMPANCATSLPHSPTASTCNTAPPGGGSGIGNSRIS